jgi:hypothetical protein
MNHVLGAVFALACAASALAGLALAWNAIRVPFNLKPGVHAWALGNPFNYLFKPETLSAAGLVLRQRAAWSLVALVSALALAGVVNVLARHLLP